MEFDQTTKMKGGQILSGLAREFRVFLAALVFGSVYLTAVAQNPPQGTQGAFFAALLRNDASTVAAMLDRDSALVRAQYFGRLPLHLAAGKGYKEIAGLLLDHGAEVNAQSDFFETSGACLTALAAASWNGHLEVCKLLLAAGADPNLQSPFFGSALHCAVKYHQTEIVNLLLNAGGDPFLSKENPYPAATALEIDIVEAGGKAVEAMLAVKQARLVAERDQLLASHGQALLAAAAERGELEAVRALISARVPAKNATVNGAPLMGAFAKALGEAKKIRGFDAARWLTLENLLLEQGVDCDVFSATVLGLTNEVRQLAAADHDLTQARDGNRDTPLHWAVRTDQPWMTSFWLRAGVPVVATNIAGQTALHIAASLGLANQTALLLAAHAATTLHDTNGWTPLDAAIQAKRPDTIRLLLAQETSPHPERGASQPLHEAAASGDISKLSALDSATKDLEARNELGLTPFAVAVQHGHLAAAAWLADKGADVNSRDPQGNTPLHQILLHEFPYIVYDRPSSAWLERLDRDPGLRAYLPYLTLGRYEQGPAPLLQAAAFLLAAGANAKASNGAGQTPMQLASDETVMQRTLLFPEDRSALLKLLRAGGGQINGADALGNTPLHLAVNEVTATRAASLLAAGANVNATNRQGRTPLHVAAARIWGWDNGDGSAEPFQLLLKYKADVNAQDTNGMTPLHVLAAADTAFKAEAARALLAAGANPNLRDKQGRTPAHAFLSGQRFWKEAADCIDMLVNAGADLSAKDAEGKTPLHYLAMLGQKRPMFFMGGAGQYLVSKSDREARDHEGNTPLHLAAKTGTRDVFDALLNEGANLDATNNSGVTPRFLAAHAGWSFSLAAPPNPNIDFFQAIQEGNLEAAKKLAAMEPSIVNQTNRAGQTPLRAALLGKRTNLVSFLEQNGAQWDAFSAVLAGRADVLRKVFRQQPAAASKRDFGETLLHYAVDQGNAEIVEAVLANQGDARAEDIWGMSPLGHALLSKRPDIAQLLLQHGAEENFIDAIYASDSATVSTWLKRDKLLASSSTNRLSPASIAAGLGEADILKLLLGRGASPRSTNAFGGLTAFHFAVIYDQTNTAELLLRHGAEMEGRDGYGLTPLHWAALLGMGRMTLFLLNHKSDPEARVSGDGPAALRWNARGSLSGDTPLHLAALAAQTNVISILLKAGASANSANNAGRTPLDLAGPMGPIEVNSLLHTAMTPLKPSFLARSTVKPLFDGAFERKRHAVALLEAAGGQRNSSYHPIPATKTSN